MKAEESRSGGSDVAQAALTFDYERRSLLSRGTGVSVYVFERLIPDPYIFAVVLTFVGAVLAYTLAPNAAPITYCRLGAEVSSRS